ncbi:molybdate ABC transporter substrate-binding protein [Rhodospirillaceae bacterium KN72]|uniref:Molybdate ABC transporter substrate-binding protein n=1 Tax=Pacificispira spongiicola TaxID=2729598 RepID=A0A7Y0HI68_9PROT|nr:molybdate ABC transporter substrate-binding protein [Pacificispira spongiicola]NMM46672.1 molybdate ABC transporter substrate-binding protein [Pacificispira spongiicola]
MKGILKQWTSAARTTVGGLSVAVGLLMGMAAMSPVLADDITVFAAASMKNAMDEVAESWQAETGHTATVSLAGSSALARQIQQGAPADIFISANVGWMDMLQKEGQIDPASRFDLLSNALVLIAYGADAKPVTIESGFDLAGMLGDGRLAMALVDAVPAGKYGKAALEALGIWDAVAPKVAQADNVRAALALVATGEAPLGVVYATDAVAAGDSVTVIGTFPGDSHPPIVYPAARVVASENPLAGDFLTFLKSEKARAAFERQGFTTLAD